ncbi:HDOD domain-containing protein [Gammaproteobacteria bacterium]
MTIIQTFDDNAVAQLLKGIDIPPQPAVLNVVMREQQRANPDLHKIAAAVSKDVGLSAAMLRAANSPAFGLRKKVTSISQAVILLGLANSMSLVTGLLLRMTMSSGRDKVKLEHFWDGATDTATICAVLARRLRIMTPDHAYMLGLFHDCGIPILMQRFSNYIDILRQANTNSQESITITEDKIFNTNHSVVGYFVTRSWFLPEEIREIVLHHHDELLLINKQNDALAKKIGFLTLAEHFSDEFHARYEEGMWKRTGGKILEIFDITETDFRDISDEMKEILSCS